MVGVASRTMQKIKTLQQNILNIIGWHTHRHILVVESDDWGSIRMPSLGTYEYLISNGVKLGAYGYEKVDTIASSEDLEKLFEVCNSFRDINGHPLVITANAVVANPDFDRIKESNFQEYFYEPITATMERYYPNRSPFPLWKEGMASGVFHPQLHGREHVNVSMWMNSLRQDYPGVKKAFDTGVFSVVVDKKYDKRERNLTALNYQNDNEFEVCKKSIEEGASMFKELFGYQSKSFIAPSYKWDERIEDVLNSVGVKYIQGITVHYSNGQRHINFVGKRNKFGQRYLIRNASFEYSQNDSFDWTNDALKRIEIAFRWHKPATISAHRLNFIGELSKTNRDENLIRFKNLISVIQKRWPDVEFMSSDELGDLICLQKRIL